MASGQQAAGEARDVVTQAPQRAGRGFDRPVAPRERSTTRLKPAPTPGNPVAYAFTGRERRLFRGERGAAVSSRLSRQRARGDPGRRGGVVGPKQDTITRSRTAKQTAPQATTGTAPPASVTIDIASLLELAAFCRDKLTEPHGGITCRPSHDPTLPPAPDTSDDAAAVHRPDTDLGPAARRQEAGTSRPARKAPRPAPRGASPRGGRS